MKIKTLSSMLQQDGTIKVWDVPPNFREEPVQWIGNDHALYPLFDLPYLDRDELFTIFDIPEKKRDGILFKHFTEPPEYLSFEDKAECENILDRAYCDITYAGMDLIPLKTQGGISLIDRKYLSPLKDLMPGLVLFERVTAGQGIYIAVKFGMLIKALIMPEDLITEQLVNKSKDFFDGCKFAFECKARRKIVEDAQNAAQITLTKSADEEA